MATDKLDRLIVGCRILGFHGGDYEECRLLGCGAVWILVKTDVSGKPVASIFTEEKILEREEF
jgi:hypothetical protein